MSDYRIEVDNSGEFEHLSLGRKLFDMFFIPILNNLPRKFQNLIRKSNNSAKKVIDNVATHIALETLYNYGYPTKSKSLPQRFFLRIWFNLHNSKAVRNRLTLVGRKIEEIVKEIDDRDDDIRILSIASGSARAVLESVRKINPNNNKVQAIFLDKNPKALEYSKNLKEELLPKSDGFAWVLDSASGFPGHVKKEDLDLVEMVGLLDYFNDDKALETFREIYKHLSFGGKLITANITDNRERPFITRVIDWPMVYRSPEELIDLAVKAGFQKEKVRATYEPLKVHIVLVAQK